MRKILLLAVFGVFLLLSCEKDDFCIQNPVTPNLILRFYNDVNRTELKQTSGLYVWSDNKDSIFVNIATDSLVIPLNTAANQTIYNLSQNNVVNQLTINYDINPIYVSRSCGFKINFENVTISSNNTWVTEVSPSNGITIDNQNAAHVQVFH